jgi:hypothetical protein
MHPSIPAELYYFLEHNPEFCTHTVDVWESEGTPSGQLFHTLQHAKYILAYLFLLDQLKTNGCFNQLPILMVFISIASAGFLYGWNWLGAIRWASF